MKKLLVLGLLLTACGTSEEDKVEKTPYECKGSYCLSATISTNPLNMTIDGESYVDSETWYTNQLDKLDQEVDKNYPGLKPRIVGSIGLSDLANGLTYIVYNESITKQQTYSYFTLDSQFKNQVFNILAVKRVNIELLNSNNQIEQTWCFNFKGTGSFLADSTVYTNIRDWKTALTRYKCTSVDSKTFGIP